MIFIAVATATTLTLDAILDDPKLAGASVSAVVTDLDGHRLYGHNEALRVVPASNQKLLTTAYALYRVPSIYRPVTKIWRLPERIVIDSPGDPLTTYPTWRNAAARLRGSGNMPVQVRESYAPVYPASWDWDDLPNRYSAPVTALTVDRGGLDLWNVNGFAQLKPSAYDIKIRRFSGPSPARIVYDPISRRVDIFGVLPKTTARLDTLSIPRPDMAVASMFGSFDSLITAADLPAEAPTIVIQGRSLGEMVRECLPPSDNNIAEHLFLIASASDADFTADPYATARRSMSSFLGKTVGLDAADYRVYDGSGLSRNNLVTSRGIAKLLAWGRKQPFSALWLDAMPRPGIGTLKNRLDGVAFAGKTGSLDMVISLSGFVRGSDGRERIVSVILNNFLCSAGDARNITDAFVREAREMPIPDSPTQ